MALVWTEEQQLLREVSRTFLDQHAPIGELRRIREESRSIRAAAMQHKLCYFTTLAGALAAALAMDHRDKVQVNRLQDLH